tara:strand:+ start:201 stop:488 length:288 start_codon:yes stop_codon:yes gene_type:complete
MKTIIASAVIAVATLTATVSNSATYTYCKEFSKLIETVGQARDFGLPASDIYQNAIDAGLPSASVVQMIQTVYIDGKLVSPSILKTISFNACLKG